MWSGGEKPVSMIEPRLGSRVCPLTDRSGLEMDGGWPWIELFFTMPKLKTLYAIKLTSRHVMTQTDPAVSSEVAHLKAQLASMTSEASSKDAVISKLQTDLDKARTDLTQCNEELRQRSAEMATVVDEFQQLERELEQSEQKYRARREVDDEYAKDLEQSLGKQERHNAFLRQLLKEKENAGDDTSVSRVRPAGRDITDHLLDIRKKER
ncbi:hypothetical protein FOZ60_015205 [Perkinsus olseni]|uniref:Uncharacterized protein n=1 Tax=Perkinsus olseni TaxID=32597 RepID=A0A7J6N6E2_PEROL|nr:hypothetical protein FOZ60_015205 [Perkinsus olseni]